MVKTVYSWLLDNAGLNLHGPTYMQLFFNWPQFYVRCIIMYVYYYHDNKKNNNTCGPLVIPHMLQSVEDMVTWSSHSLSWPPCQMRPKREGWQKHTFCMPGPLHPFICTEGKVPGPQLEDREVNNGGFQKPPSWRHNPDCPSLVSSCYRRCISPAQNWLVLVKCPG